jgi:trehalose 6-phosphate synthase
VARLVVVSNRVAPIREGEPTQGGLAAGVLDALRTTGGIWFGWSGAIAESSPSFAGPPQHVGPISLYTIPLGQADYDMCVNVTYMIRHIS